MKLNNDTPIHLSINTWVFNSSVDVVADVVKNVAARFNSELNSMLSRDIPVGAKLVIQEDCSDSLARKTLINILFATLDVELVRTEIGAALKNKLLLVCDALELPQSDISWLELDSADLFRLFDGVVPFEN